MNANEARKLSNSNGFDKKVQERIKEIEKDILIACNQGRTSTCVFAFYSDYDKNDVDLEVKKHFKKLGYSFKRTGICGGVPQTTEDITW